MPTGGRYRLLLVLQLMLAGKQLPSLTAQRRGGVGLYASSAAPFPTHLRSARLLRKVSGFRSGSLGVCGSASHRTEARAHCASE